MAEFFVDAGGNRVQIPDDVVAASTDRELVASYVAAGSPAARAEIHAAARVTLGAEPSNPPANIPALPTPSAEE